MSDIVILGEVMIEIAPVDEQHCRVGAAGDTYNTACTLQGLGFDATYITALGCGKQAEKVRAHAAAHGVSLREPPIDTGRSPGLYMIDNDESGERTFEYWRKDSAASALFKDANLLHAVLQPVSSVPYCYFTGITLALMNGATRDAFLAFLATYRSSGGTVIFDPNYRPALWASRAEAADAIATARAQADIYLPGFEEEVTLYDCSSIDAAAAAILATGIGESVMKNGPDSCVLIADSTTREVAITPTDNVVDTTGAGDTFNGAYISARLAQLAPVDAIAFAASAAAEVLQIRGGVLATKQLRALKTRLQQQQQQQ